MKKEGNQILTRYRFKLMAKMENMMVVKQTMINTCV